MVTIQDLLDFIERHHVPLSSEVQVTRDHSTDPINGIDVESIEVIDLSLTTEGLLRIEIF